jgi:formamidopyrimidine-DNA glycosylase
MIELPEAITLSKQLNDTINGKIISNLIAAHTKQKLTWYYGNPEKYQNLLQKKKLTIQMLLVDLLEFQHKI